MVVPSLRSPFLTLPITWTHDAQLKGGGEEEEEEEEKNKRTMVSARACKSSRDGNALEIRNWYTSRR